MQTLFLRFHNYIASKLSLLNPIWSDEILYQESRRIVIGSIQRIVYKDFLPIIIGMNKTIYRIASKILLNNLKLKIVFVLTI